MRRHTRSNPLFGHASLMQSGFVQARMKPRIAPGFSKVIVRSFDNGHDTGGTPSTRETIDLDASQYDVLTCNPGLDIYIYEQKHATATEKLNGNVHEYDVAALNPSFDPTLYEVAPGEPEEAKPQPTETRPATMPSPPAETRVVPSATPTLVREPSAVQNGSTHPAPVARASSFTARQLDKLVTDEHFRADLDAILGGVDKSQTKTALQQDGGSAPTARRQPSAGKQAAQGNGQSNSTIPPESARELPDRLSEHAIFDKIAENMQFATAYELPSLNLSRRFDSFDRQGPRRTPAVRPRTKSKPADPSATTATPSAENRAAPTASASPTPVPETPAVTVPENGGAENRAPIRQDVAPITPNEQPAQLPPAPPLTLRPYSEAEMVATYGDPRVDSDTWIAENVTTVQIPQLEGVPRPDGVASNSSVAFHRLGTRSLSDLFAAWELAGLMGKVLSFDGGHAAQSPHSEGVDAHTWAIAFDINAKWNPAGEPPVAVTVEGSVAELVEIANQHGFIWGGHDPRRKAGLHFELGNRI